MAHSANFCDHCGAAISDQTITCPACGEIQASVHALPALTPKRNDRPAPSPLLTERYRILAQIGQGGFGVVYKAHDRKLGRIVAIKQITLAALNTRQIIDATDSYNRETTILPRLEHKRLPHVYDHFTDPEHWYIVMDYIEGQTLEEMLAKAKDGRLPVEQALKIGQGVVEILGYLHGQKQPVIFRDVKPGNIMVTKSNAVYLIDFGIARYYRAEKQRDTGALGSPGYAAPEQYGTAQSTTQTDLYGLGATLQTMLTGKEPNEGADIYAEKHLPDQLQSLIAWMIQQDPKQRPSNVLYVGEELASIQKQLQKKKPVAVPPFAWLGAIWMLLYPIVMEAIFPIYGWYFYFLISTLIFLVFGIVYFFKERPELPRHRNRKKTLARINKGLFSATKWAIYTMSGNINIRHNLSNQAFLLAASLLVFWMVVGFLLILNLHKILKWIQKIKDRANKKQKVQDTAPQQQMS
jgi:serine/threonine protein kinase